MGGPKILNGENLKFLSENSKNYCESIQKSVDEVKYKLDIKITDEKALGNCKENGNWNGWIRWNEDSKT